MPIVVMKFGGTSVADPDAMGRVARIVRERYAGGVHPVVVVSAMAGVTDTLLGLARAAADGDRAAVDRGLDALSLRHTEVAAGFCGTGASALADDLVPYLDELRTLLAAAVLLRDVQPRALDVVAATGELLNSRIVTAAMREVGLPAEFVDARRIVMTDASHTEALPLAEATRAAAERVLRPLLDAGRIPVLGGFVGSAPDGATTTLGRGGSDYSASVVGAAIDAAEIQIWTDVDGILSADPRLIDDPRPVPRLSFAEASELAYFGAKVLHPSTLLPAMARGIPVRILNSLRPAAEGSVITSAPPADDRPVTAIACKRGITVIDVVSTRMLMAHGFLRRVFDTFERHRTAVDVVTTSEVSVSVTVDDASRVPGIVEALREFADVSTEGDMAIVSVVGENLRRRPEMVSRIIGAIAHVPLRMVSQAAGRRNLTVVVAGGVAAEAIDRLHDAFLEDSGILETCGRSC